MPIDTNVSTATILAGNSASTFVPVANIHQLSFWIPSVWDAANVSVQLSRLSAPTSPAVEAEWFTVADAFGEVSFPAKANHTYSLSTTILLPNAKWLRLISGTAAARVNQVADRAIEITTRRY